MRAVTVLEVDGRETKPDGRTRFVLINTENYPLPPTLYAQLEALPDALFRCTVFPLAMGMLLRLEVNAGSDPAVATTAVLDAIGRLAGSRPRPLSFNTYFRRYPAAYAVFSTDCETLLMNFGQGSYNGQSFQLIIVEHTRDLPLTAITADELLTGRVYLGELKTMFLVTRCGPEQVTDHTDLVRFTEWVGTQLGLF